MTTATFPEDYYLTVEELHEDMEGRDFKATEPEKDHFLCDFCSKGVAYESQPRVGFYMADGVLGTDQTARQINNQGKLVSLASYCEECATKMLLFPCEGFTEVRLFYDLDTDRVMKNIEITDVSGTDDGIPWNPRELSEKITGVPFEANAAMAGEKGVYWGPENMVTFFMSAVKGTDIRELVKWDGSLDPKMLGQARRKYEEFQQKMSSQSHDRRAFSKHVRGDTGGES